MKRRAFLSLLVAAPFARAIAAAAPARVPALAFDANAFRAMDFETGIAIRFVRHFDVARLNDISRFDVFLMAPGIEPAASCRVLDA